MFNVCAPSRVLCASFTQCDELVTCKSSVHDENISYEISAHRDSFNVSQCWRRQRSGTASKTEWTVARLLLPCHGIVPALCFPSAVAANKPRNGVPTMFLVILVPNNFDQEAFLSKSHPSVPSSRRCRSPASQQSRKKRLRTPSRRENGLVQELMYHHDAQHLQSFGTNALSVPSAPPDQHLASPPNSGRDGVIQSSASIHVTCEASHRAK